MTNTALTIRRATATDAFALRRLAAIDSASPPTGDVLLAEMGERALGRSIHRHRRRRSRTRSARAPTSWTCCASAPSA